MIICPDIHGREFWKEALTKYPEEKVIFLGDYVDPYPTEGITREKAIEVLKEIIKAAEEEPDRITLLLGNHDLMYLHPDRNAIGCRHDYLNEPEITKLLWRPDLFKLAEILETPDRTYVFSHSGIHTSWLTSHPEFGADPKDSVQYLNKFLWDTTGGREGLMKALLEISWWRGGDFTNGSPVWADVREYDEEDWGNIYQVFGHTQLRDQPIETDSFICLDCRKAFRLTPDYKFELL